jgi:hypothetical protein
VLTNIIFFLFFPCKFPCTQGYAGKRIQGCRSFRRQGHNFAFIQEGYPEVVAMELAMAHYGCSKNNCFKKMV